MPISFMKVNFSEEKLKDTEDKFSPMAVSMLASLKTTSQNLIFVLEHK